MSIITLWKVDIFLIGKELYESTLIFSKLRLILFVIPIFYLEDIQSCHKFYQTIHNEMMLNV